MAALPFEAWRDSAETIIEFKVKKQVLLGHIRPPDADDVRQRLWECVTQHIGKFDPAKAKLATFITRIVDSHLTMYFRDRSRQKRAPEYTTRSLDEEVREKDGKPGEPRSARLGLADHARRMGLQIDEDAERTKDRIFLREAINTLPPELGYLVPLMGDLKEAAIARVSGRSRRQVKKDLARLREHFRCAAGDDD